MTHPAFHDVKPVSHQRLNITGLLVTLYGIEELPNQPGPITCLWLLHGRSDTQDSMAYIAAAFLNAWNSKRKPGQKSLICVCIDHRNHGSRMIDNLSNVSWKQGNPNHGPDMFNTYSGTALDVGHLITHLPSYLPFAISEHICGGLSLGAHASWILLMNEPRIKAGIIIIGCPDYVRLMTDRAVRSKVPTAVSSDPPGRNFVGSKDFPRPLVEAVERFDPAGILLGELDVVTGDDYLHEPSESEKKRLRPIMAERLAGKKTICLSGGKDRLVPYACGEPFITWLQRATDKDTGWFNGHGTELESIVDKNAKHECTKYMRQEAERWLCKLLADDEDGSASTRESKL